MDYYQVFRPTQWPYSGEISSSLVLEFTKLRVSQDVGCSDPNCTDPACTTEAPSLCDDPSCRDPRCRLRPISRVSTMPKLSSRPPSDPCSDPRCNDPRCFAATTRLSTEPLASTRQSGSAFYRDLPPRINSGATVNDEGFLARDGGYGSRGSIYSSFISPDIRPTSTYQHFQTPPISRRNSTGVYGSSLVITAPSFAPSFRPVNDPKEWDWKEDNTARMRTMGIEETAMEDEGGDPYGYPSATREHRRRRHRRNNDSNAGTDNLLRSRHAMGKRSTRPRESQRETYSDDKEPRESSPRHSHLPSSSQQSTSKRNKDEINIIVDDKTIIIFQNGASARITMGDLPPGEGGEGGDGVYNDRAIADRVNKWMAKNEASYVQSDQSTLLALPAPPTTCSASRCSKALISSAVSRSSRSFRSIPLKYHVEDTKRPTNITFHLEIPDISAA